MHRIKNISFLIMLGLMNTANAGTLDSITTAFDAVDIKNTSRPISNEQLIKVIEDNIDTAIASRSVPAAVLATFLTELAFIRTGIGHSDTTRILFTKAAELGDPAAQIELAHNLSRRSLPLGTVHWVYEALSGAVSSAALLAHIKGKILEFAPGDFIEDVDNFVKTLQKASPKLGTGGRDGSAGAGAGGGSSGSSPTAVGASSVVDWKDTLVRSFLKRTGYMDRGFTYNPALEAVKWGAGGSYNFNDPIFANCVELYCACDPTVFNSVKYALTAEEVASLVESKNFRRLDSINLSGLKAAYLGSASITDKAVEDLAANDAFGALRTINLEDNDLGNKAVQALAISTALGSRMYGLWLPMGRGGRKVVEIQYALGKNCIDVKGMDPFLDELLLTVELWHPAAAKPTAKGIAATRIANVSLEEQVPEIQSDMIRAFRATKEERGADYLKVSF